MTAALLLALLSAEPELVPPPPLMPAADLSAQLAALEEQRAPIESGRHTAFRVRIAAGVGYTLFAVSALWGLIELFRFANNKATVPLGGAPYQPSVPPVALGVSSAVLGALAITLHVVAHSMDARLDGDEEELDEAERPVRKQLAEVRESVEER